MKPIPVTVKVQVPLQDVVSSVETSALGHMVSYLANRFVSSNFSSFFGTGTTEADAARRKAAIEIHATLSEGAKRLLSEVLALEFARVTAPQPTPTPEPQPEEQAVS